MVPDGGFDADAYEAHAKELVRFATGPEIDSDSDKEDKPNTFPSQTWSHKNSLRPISWKSLGPSSYQVPVDPASVPV